MKKVTLQEIANTLGVSRTTVWKVFSGHGGVSDALRDKIIATAAELNYPFPEDFPYPQADKGSDKPTNIAVAVCRPETSIFWMTILHEIAKELTLHNVNLVYIYLPSYVDEDFKLPPALTNGTIHGVIVMNVYNARLLHLLAATPTPKVFLDSATEVLPNELNGDLILMENRSSISEITRHLIAQGRKSFGFIGDVNYAKSNHERFDGFRKTLTAYQIPLQPQLFLTSSIGIDTYREEIDSFLDTLTTMPDAFVCASDHVACILIQLLEKRGIRVPEDIAVSGFDNNTEHPLAEDLTSVRVFNHDIGFRLATQILYRIQHTSRPFEVTYVKTDVVFRKSTGDSGG